MLRLELIGLLGLVVACGNTVIIEGGAGGAASTSRSSSGSGGASVSVVSVGPGTTSTTVASTTIASSSSGGINCLNEPDCPTCFCNQQPNGCFAYQQAIVDFIYCGMTCGMACSDFCVNQQNVPPACDDCVAFDLSQGDIDTFIAACEASPDCIEFALDIQQCP